MKYFNRQPSLHRVLALLIASAAWSAWPCAHAAAGDTGTRDFASEEKLLGGPDTYGAGYADPYGQDPAGKGGKNGGKNGAKAAAGPASAPQTMPQKAAPP